MRPTFFVLFLMLGFIARAQDNVGYCSCEQDVDAYADGLKEIVLAGELQQIQDSIEYLDRIDIVSRDIKRYDMCDISSVECLRHLNRLGTILNIKSILPQTRLLEKRDTLTRSENKFTSSPLAYIAYEGDLTQLREKLTRMPDTDLEGVYTKQGLEVAVVKDDRQRDYRFYVLKSEYEHVSPGALVALAKIKYDSTLTTHSVINTRRNQNYLPLDMFMDGRILKSGLAKSHEQHLQQYLPVDSLPTFQPLTEEIAYTSFSQNGVQSYDHGGMDSSEIEAGLRDPAYKHIIVDLRTWYGHSYTTDANLLDALEDIEEEKHFYVLVGASTGGATERLALYLHLEKEAVIIGHPSAGNLDLSKYDENRTKVLPSGRFYYSYEVPPLDNLSSFEFSGVPIDQILKADKPVLEQVVQYIQDVGPKKKEKKIVSENRSEERKERREERLEEINERREEMRKRKEKEKNG